MNAGIILILTGMALIGFNWLYTNRPRIHIEKIVLMSANQLLYDKHSVARMFRRMDNPEIPPPLDFNIDNVYDKCIQNGIEKYLVVDDKGKAVIRQILLDNKAHY
jgi:hypothetical protein